MCFKCAENAILNRENRAKNPEIYIYNNAIIWHLILYFLMIF